MVTIEEIKEELFQRGISEKLLDMPAVLGRISEILEKYSQDAMKVRLDSFLTVEKNGDFSYAIESASKASFTIGEDDGAIIEGAPHDDSKIHVNKFGIEDKYEDGDWMGLFTNISRADGKVIRRSGNNGTASFSENVYLDSGSWAITDRGIELDETQDINLDEALMLFDSKAEEVIESYPETAPWYKKTRLEVETAATTKIDPQEEIRRLREENESLKAEKKQLFSRVESLTHRLSKTLNFAEKVRKHPLGRVFFNKQLRELEDRTLSKSNDNEIEK